MFSTSAAAKVHSFDIYTTIQAQLQTIKNLQAFTNFTQLSPNELITISNTTLDCVEKLGEVSSFFIKKLNDTTLSTTTVDKLFKMFEEHNDLLKLIYKFNLISSDISNNYKDIFANNMNQDIINFVFYDIINRNKLIILQIFESIKKLNVYSSLLKDKLSA